ncbi:MAG: hypothetical protein OIN86_09925 [Candidatus Methanoperedens sp.]|nr:hypothetical protein [Candidatus Methanoperedens sp.]CAG0982152.1 hypothetical protein METP1_01834 [Methanosarcinales archaeon]
MVTFDKLVEWYAGDMQCWGCGATLTTEYTLERHHCTECLKALDKPVMQVVPSTC